jgi:hypothetical protein
MLLPGPPAPPLVDAAEFQTLDTHRLISAKDPA